MSITKLRWDDEYDRCLGCGTRGQDKPHVAEGLCTDCFPQRYGDFGLGDVQPMWAEAGASLPPAPAAAAHQWNSRWQCCLLCGGVDRPHLARGMCDRCENRSRTHWKREKGLTLIWLPFYGGNLSLYDRNRMKRWATVRDWEEVTAYLVRRAAAGELPTGGKVIIRATKDADRLPERVIRPVAA